MLIEVPRDRLGTFEPQILPKHSRRVEPLNDRILALYARGMSVRDIGAHLEELYGTDVSPDLISRVTDAVWDEIRDWQSRPLENTYAVVWLDALFVKMRDQGTVQTKAVYVAVGLRLDGRREVLGLWVDGAEGAKFWMRVLAELRSRGVQDVLICCCDGLKGFPQAIAAIFPKSVVQTCIVHQVRYSLSFVGWQDRKQVRRLSARNLHRRQRRRPRPTPWNNSRKNGARVTRRSRRAGERPGRVSPPSSSSRRRCDAWSTRPIRSNRSTSSYEK